jgi:hypothetical protein
MTIDSFVAHAALIWQRMQHRVQMTANRLTQGFNYGFVEYDDPGAAERGMATLNGRRIHNNVSAKPGGYSMLACVLTQTRKSA